ncbi:TIGR02391 family protein [Nocardioides sp. NPDC051685]|uniref:TIGR02391 family protein n=1 Tax=Nocardioides sp. NPDC051685 TaxID=3364334 RepID=UPI0037B651F9
MSRLTIAHKTFLEAALEMSSGYVLDFSNTRFAQFFADMGIDIFEERYAEYGPSKANRLRTLWQIGSEVEVRDSLNALADYIDAKNAVDGTRHDASDGQVQRIREITEELNDGLSEEQVHSGPVAITTEATVTDNLISIVIHEELYSHISPYLRSGDYYHAVEESYKLVREKLRDLTGKEKASDIFNNSAQNDAHYGALFGKAKATDAAEADFFRGVGYLHLGVQHLRNEKAHTPASPLEPNLALHYIALASLAYDLVTRYVSEDTIHEIEEFVRQKRRSYRTASAFYRDFEGGHWLQKLDLPIGLTSAPVRKALKEKWLGEADFTHSFDHSNVIWMQLELVTDQLTREDLDRLLDLPTKDSYGNDQQAGEQQFLEFVDERFPTILSEKARQRLANLRES